MVAPLWALNIIKKIVLHEKVDQSSPKFLGDATSQNPQPSKILWRSVKNAGDIRDRKFVLPKKVSQSSPKIFRGCYPIRPLIMPNFIKIGQTSLEIGGVNWASDEFFFLFCHGRTET